jgi:hypothetical protein
MKTFASFRFVWTLIVLLLGSLEGVGQTVGKTPHGSPLDEDPTFSALDEASKAKYRTAYKHVYRAFGNHWFGTSNGYFSVIVKANPAYDQMLLDEAPNSAESLAREELKNKIVGAEQWLKRCNAEVRRLLEASYSLKREARENKEKAEEDLAKLKEDYAANLERSKERRKTPKTFSRYVQLRGVKGKILLAPLTEADELNGITYQGMITFGFRVYRFYEPGKGWTDWLDVARMPEQIAPFISAFIGQFMGSGNFPNLTFTFQERDQNWKVTTDSNETYLNGKRLGPDESERSYVPPAVRAALPDPKKVEDFLHERTPRDEARELGDWARKNPDVLEATIKNTMKLLEESR